MNVSSNLFQWFTENELKGNASKCHLLMMLSENVHVNVGTSQIKNSDYERLLGTDIDCKLSFKDHTDQICSKTRAKTKVLARIAPFLNKRKKTLLINVFFKSQYSYCPLLYMFHSCTLNNKIKRLHGGCLHIIYNGKISSFTDLLEIDYSVSMHHRNIQVIAAKLFKFFNDLSLKLVSDYFKLNNMTVFNTRNNSTFYSQHQLT